MHATDSEPKRDRPPARAREVSIRELDRHASRAIAEVANDGVVLAVTRHGIPVALILPIDVAISQLPADYVMGGQLGELSKRFVARADRRWESKLMHGRWWPEWADR